MSKFKGGYVGNVLRVDLSKGKILKEYLRKDLALNFIGGRGIASKILYEELRPRIDPLSPDNILIFSTGPATGLPIPSASRYTVSTKSPLTFALGDGNSGGHWAPELKYAGYDHLIFYGRAKKPVYLWIDDGQPQIKNASHIWGKDTHETEDIIKEELGDKTIRVSSIGPAGENLVRFASIICDRYSAAARCGIGAVQGSKNLKAIAVRGTGNVKVADYKGFMDYLEKVYLEAENLGLHLSTLTSVGSLFLIDSYMEFETGKLPINNFTTCEYPEWETLSAHTINEKYLLDTIACFSCPIRCNRRTLIKEGIHAGTHGAIPEYESLSALGPRCGVWDFPTIAKANLLCDKYGMDTISTGGVIAFAFECYERGLITKEDTDGLELGFGNAEVMLTLIEKIAKREGFGGVLAEGSRLAAEKIGRGTEKYAMVVKGMEMPGQDVRAQQSMGLAHAVSTRGADHLRGLPFDDIHSGRAKELAENLLGETPPEALNMRIPKYKHLIVIHCEHLKAVVDSMEVCEYQPVYRATVRSPGLLAEAYEVITGFPMTAENILKIGERIVNIERVFNVREGFTRKDDYLPERFTKEPAPNGPARGHTVKIDELLENYYKARGWTKEGIPTTKKLAELGLRKIAEEARYR